MNPAEVFSRVEKDLEGKPVAQMSDDELLIWFNACERREKFAKHSKVRRSWKQLKNDAKSEIKKRNESHDFSS